nr:RNA-directed DNA polymerase, eukaryota, reverse transcriptase zinc-binding domain protein [Tanacetum cinerariifolium]
MDLDPIPTSDACATFQSNESMKRVYSSFQNVSPSFKVDERLIWIEINGLPLCAWALILLEKLLAYSVSNEEETKVEKVADSFDDNSVDGLEGIIKDLAEDKDEEKPLDNSSKYKSGECKQLLNEVNSVDTQSSKHLRKLGISLLLD